jgi:hypothetical protein
MPRRWWCDPDLHGGNPVPAVFVLGFVTRPDEGACCGVHVGRAYDALAPADSDVVVIRRVDADTE